LKKLYIIVFIVFGLFYLSGCYCCPLYVYFFNVRKMARETAILAGCEENIKTLSTALAMYAIDYSNEKNGKTVYYYPAKLNIIYSGYTKKFIPQCPKCNVPYTYIPSKDKTSYILFCPGKGVHSITGKVPQTGSFPQYTPEEGLIEK